MFVIKDLHYGTKEKGRLYDSQTSASIQDNCDDDKYKLDLYIPGQAKPAVNINQLTSNERPQAGASPIVVFIHGGGWRRGDRSAWKHYTSALDTNILVAFILRLFRLYGNIGEAFAERGIACAIVSYPFSKLSTGWILFEMLTSYIMSSLFVAPICIILLLTVCSILERLPSFYTSLNYLNDWCQILFISLSIVNLIISILMTVFKERYKLSVLKVCTLWAWNACVLCGSKMLGQTGRQYIPFCSFLTTFIFTQGMLFFGRLQRKGVTYLDQIKAVEDAIMFMKKYGTENKLCDTNRIYLMGHSAGGHLVTLFTLQYARADNDFHDLNIQGIISISGVFDLPKLNKSALKPLYLYPTFGRNYSDWTKASPTHVIAATTQDEPEEDSKGKLSDLPPFLLITAERDLHLQADAEALAERITANGGRCFLKTICPSNHFTIVWDFKADPEASNTKLTQICVDFVLKSGQFALSPI